MSHNKVEAVIKSSSLELKAENNITAILARIATSIKLSIGKAEVSINEIATGTINSK